jgi:hypothetical protein
MMMVTRLIYDSQGRYAEAEPLYAGCSCGARCWASAIPPASTTWPGSPEARRDDSQRMVIRVEAGQRPEGPVDQSRHYHHDCLSSAALLFLGANILH